MECTICKQILSTDSNHHIDGKDYCPGCADVSSFADMVYTNENIKLKISKKQNINSDIKLPKEITINYRCIKCHKDTSGNNCQHCGYLSPLSNPRRKKI
jgi:hypothetical protein